MAKPKSEADQLVDAALIVTTHITGLLHGLDVIDPVRARGLRRYVHEQVSARVDEPTEKAS